ncbi:hypothetical protein E6W39_23225 [Kitasatospora acidiphila]|uniref:Uncharacterized protein n=1 Tax=Kitasatospora acidiphila TaxID=2567942 RepID=A0A540W6F5_9ACTN|nr:hypothetical protein [Kitasatospora acidiphila]TQF04605.1 hypothetical protein E6W39_23225 [Kitasatospora acidiphila]
MTDPHGPQGAASGEPLAEPAQPGSAAENDLAAAQAPDQAEPEDRAGHAWDSRRDLLRHSPGIMLGRAATLGGSLVGGDQHGVSGGQVIGDVILGGSKVEYHLGGDDEERSGEIPVAEVEALARHFVQPAAASVASGEPAGGQPDSGTADADAGWQADSPFGVAVEELRKQRVVVLSGPATTGRRTAALMLLRAVRATAYRAMDPGLAPGRLAGELREHCGHLLADYATSAERPLREHHLRALSERLGATGGHLVIVVGPHPVIQGGSGHVPWQPPAPELLLRGHLRHKELGGRGIDELLALPEVRSVLGHPRPVAELARFADRVAEYARGARPLDSLAAFGHYAAERQVREWFDDTVQPPQDGRQPLHDKAFLIALAAFDEGPYALTAELGDDLFGRLQRIEDPGEPARIPVFGTSSAQRVEYARADRYEEAEETEWGPVLQTKIQFRDPLAAITLLREVWTGHPSSRPALVGWLRRMATDPRPLVRTRAASTTAVLAETDLSSTMALLITRWAAGRLFRERLAAANALTLAHHLGAPHVPRILRGWCTDPDHRLRWTAVRAYALVGDTFPEQAVAALVEAVRAYEGRGGAARAWSEELDELAQSAAALLLAAGQNGAEPDGGPGGADAATDLWPTLVPLTTGRGRLREFVLRTVIHACGPADGEPGIGRPLLLDQFARADRAPGTPGALLRQALAALWRTVLNDAMTSQAGLEDMRRWVRAADRDPEAEQALGELLPKLAVSVEDGKRLAYLLENLRGGEPEQERPAVAMRLLAVLRQPSATAHQAPHHLVS